MIEDFVSDTFERLNIPMPSSATSAILCIPRMIINQRMQEKRDILINEIKKGDLLNDKMTEDEFVSSVWRIHMAIIQGASAINIRLLAKILVGLSDSNTPLYADQFLRYSQILETLSAEEIYILGRISQEILKIYPMSELNSGVSIDMSKFHGLVAKIHKKYIDEGNDGYVFEGYCVSLLRTGLILPQPAIGGMVYLPSIQLVNLIKVIQNNPDVVLG